MTPNPAKNQAEIDVMELFALLWQGRVTIAATTGIVTVLAIIYALLATPIYRSQALVQVRDSAGTTQLGALTQQLGGLADLAGFPIAGGSDRAVSIATLKSRALVTSFIDENKLLLRIYHDDVDEGTGKWKNEDPDKQPTLWKAYEHFHKSIFRVSEDKKTQLVTIAVEWEDPAEAQRWVSGLIAKTNAYLKAKASQEAEANLAYLRRQVEQTSVVPLQQALYTLVEAEQKKLMIAQGSAEYALITVDPADKPEKRVKPQRRIIAAVGLILGGFLGVVIALVRDFRHSVKSAT